MRGPWKHGSIPVLGLVGGIGAGKSRVASILATLGAQVLDADAIGHVLIDQTPSRDEVVTRFGDAVLDRTDEEAPKIDRRALGSIVFSDPAALKALEAILHPRMRLTFEKAIARAARKRQVKAVVLDAAVLFEAKWNSLCDLVLCVDAPADVRLDRVKAARGWTSEALEARERLQMPGEARRAKCDFAIDNAGDEAALTEAVTTLWDRIVRSRATSRVAPRRPERGHDDTTPPAASPPPATDSPDPD